MEVYIGQIIPFAGNYEIQGWAFCNGQLLSIAQYTALFSVIGTYYGGNGTTNFALPDLRGSFPMHFSPAFPIGQKAGSNTVTLTTQQMPQHSHSLMVSNANGTQGDPTGGILAQTNDGSARTATIYPTYVSTAPTGAASGSSIGPSGGNQPVNITPPFVAVNFLIALQGLFPPRN